jgi:hypothetical protein
MPESSGDPISLSGYSISLSQEPPSSAPPLMPVSAPGPQQLAVDEPPENEQHMQPNVYQLPFDT